MRSFSVLGCHDKNVVGCPVNIPWDMIAPHEAQAQKNHGQSLATLNSRGGLSPNELRAVLSGESWSSVHHYHEQTSVVWLIEKLHAWLSSHPWRADGSINQNTGKK